MDKTIRILLACGIAILFPVLVYFACLTIFPKAGNFTQPTPPEYPSEPSCTYQYTYYGGDSSNGVNTVPLSCQRQQAAYQEQLRQYDQKENLYEKQQNAYNHQQEHDRKINFSDRAVVAILISVVAICFCVFIRDIKELAAGLAIGAVLTIVVAISMVISFMGTTNVDGWPTAAISLSFVVLTAVLYVLDKHLPHQLHSPAPLVPNQHFTAQPVHADVPSPHSPADQHAPQSSVEENRPKDNSGNNSSETN